MVYGLRKYLITSQNFSWFNQNTSATEKKFSNKINIFSTHFLLKTKEKYVETPQPTLKFINGNSKATLPLLSMVGESYITEKSYWKRTHPPRCTVLSNRIFTHPKKVKKEKKIERVHKKILLVMVCQSKASRHLKKG